MVNESDLVVGRRVIWAVGLRTGHGDIVKVNRKTVDLDGREGKQRVDKALIREVIKQEDLIQLRIV